MGDGKQNWVGILMGVGLVIVVAAAAVSFGARNPARTVEEKSEVKVGAPQATGGGTDKIVMDTTTGGITLTVSSPADGATVTSAQLTVRGKTSPGAEVAVNEKETKADAAGSFGVSLVLEEGENYILIVANDSEGNVAEKELMVNYVM